jgi:hypothetical protein
MVWFRDHRICPNAEEGRDYVSTHGFSKIMRLHLRWCFDWRRRDAGGRHAPSAGPQGRKKEASQGAQNCAPYARP